jgi:hypothetical protein
MAEPFEWLQLDFLPSYGLLIPISRYFNLNRPLAGAVNKFGCFSVVSEDAVAKASSVWSVDPELETWIHGYNLSDYNGARWMKEISMDACSSPLESCLMERLEMCCPPTEPSTSLLSWCYTALSQPASIT